VLAATHDPAVRAVAHRQLWMSGGVLHEEPATSADATG
jgi:hypothetical protein